MTLSPTKLIDSIPELKALPAHRKAQVARFETGAPSRYRWYPGIAFLMTFFGWMMLFGKGTDFLEKYPQWDLLGFLCDLGWSGYLAAILLGYGLAITLGFVVQYRVHCFLLSRHLGKLLRENCCLWCGYNLTGNVSGRCPECGTSIRGG